MHHHANCTYCAPCTHHAPRWHPRAVHSRQAPGARATRAYLRLHHVLYRTCVPPRTAEGKLEAAFHAEVERYNASSSGGWRGYP
jgi:hypothetical protein